jgi:sarcosine oxidase
VKIATEQHEAATTPESVAREVAPDEIRAMYEEKVAPCFPGLSAECVKAVTCLYTMTADCRFVIEPHPQVPSAIVASPCSGHGFKHSAALGEALAQVVADGESRIDLAGFGWRATGGRARS